MAKTSHFQFGIGRLIILTSAVAVVMAVSIRLDVPRLAQWVFAGYLAFFVGWAVMRGPNMYAKLRDARAKRRMLKQRRGELDGAAGRTPMILPFDRHQPAISTPFISDERFRRLIIRNYVRLRRGRYQAINLFGHSPKNASTFHSDAS